MSVGLLGERALQDVINHMRIQKTEIPPRIQGRGRLGQSSNANLIETCVACSNV